MTDMSLTAGMRIEIATVYAAVAVSSRPAALPDDADWPPPEGKRVIYKIGAGGGALCSECIQDDERVTETRREYGIDTKIRQVPRGENTGWHCTARTIGDGWACREYGDKLT